MRNTELISYVNKTFSGNIQKRFIELIESGNKNAIFLIESKIRNKYNTSVLRHMEYNKEQLQRMYNKALQTGKRVNGFDACTLLKLISNY